jgi:hypothetical protein
MRGLASKTEGRRESQGGLEEGAAIWVFAKIAMSGCYKSDEHADDHNSTLLSVQELGCGTYGPSRSETLKGWPASKGPSDDIRLLALSCVD